MKPMEWEIEHEYDQKQWETASTGVASDDSDNVSSHCDHNVSSTCLSDMSCHTESGIAQTTAPDPEFIEHSESWSMMNRSMMSYEQVLFCMTPRKDIFHKAE